MQFLPRHFLWTLFAACWLLAAAPAQAQNATVSPGAVRHEFTRPYTPLSEKGFVLPEALPSATPPWAETVSLTLRDIDIDGSTVFTEADFLPLYRDLLGKKIKLSAVYEVAQAITRKYADAGYPLSFAIVPVQEIEGGRVRIQVAEGFVSEITLAGAPLSPRRLGLVHRMKDRLLAARPLTLRALERYLLLLGDLPGLDVHAIFERKEGEFAATRLTLVFEEKNVAGRLAASNRGSQAFGRGRGEAELSLHSFLKGNESVTFNAVRTASARELGYLSSEVSVPLDEEGLVFGAEASWSDTEPGLIPLRAVDFRSTGVTGKALLRKPFLRSRAQNVFATAALERDAFESKTFAGVQSRDELWVASATADWDRARGRWQHFATVELRRGLGVFGATTGSSPLRSDVGGSGVFTVLRAEGGSTVALEGPWSLLFTARAQGASRALLSPEQCGYGGPSAGHAYDNFEISGDQCAAAGAELRGTFADIFGLDVLQPYLGGDAGRVWRKGTLLPGEQKHEGRKTLDLGARFRWQSVSGYLELARPVDEPVTLEGDRTPRVFFEIGWDF